MLVYGQNSAERDASIECWCNLSKLGWAFFGEIEGKAEQRSLIAVTVYEDPEDNSKYLEAKHGQRIEHFEQ